MREIKITETTIKELLLAIKEAKESCNLQDIIIESGFSKDLFLVKLEREPNTQESLGYKFNFPETVYSDKTVNDKKYG